MLHIQKGKERENVRPEKDGVRKNCRKRRGIKGEKWIRLKKRRKDLHHPPSEREMKKCKNMQIMLDKLRREE